MRRLEMRVRILCAIFFVCLSLSLLPAQDKNAQPATFKSKTELVVVPVLVSDKQGQPIRGLKADDFILVENGSETRVAFFEEVNTSANRMQYAQSDPGTFTNTLLGSRGSARVTILVLDLLNTEVMDQQYARDQLTKYLADSLDASEPTALFVLNRQGLRLIHDFTADPKILCAAIKKMRELHTAAADSAVAMQQTEDSIRIAADRMGGGGGSNTVMSEFVEAVVGSTKDVSVMQQGFVIRQTLMAMQNLAQYAKGIPGRKALVWATGSFPFQLSSVEESFSRSTRESFADLYPFYERTWQALVSANVALYPVDVRGLMPRASIRADLRWYGVVGIVAAQSEINSPVDWSQLQSFDSLRVFAQATGGKAFLNNNDVTKGFREAAADSSHYYLLSFYLDKNAKPGWHKLAVKTRNAAQVRARTGFVVSAPSEAKTNEQIDIYSSLRSPLNYTKLPMTFRWNGQLDAAAKGHVKVGYEVELPSGAVIIDDANKNRIALQFLALVRDGEGKEVGHPESRKLDLLLSAQSLVQVRESGITYKNVLELPPGDYTVRFVVRDVLSGKMGSVSAPVSVGKG